MSFVFFLYGSIVLRGCIDVRMTQDVCNHVDIARLVI